MIRRVTIVVSLIITVLVFFWICERLDQSEEQQVRESVQTY